MTNREFTKLGMQLVAGLPGYRVSGPLVFSVSTGGNLKGLCFEGSSFDKNSYYVWAFIQPLYVPTDCLWFNLGERLRTKSGADRWSRDSDAEELREAVEQQAVPLITKADTPSDLIAVATKLHANQDVRVAEGIAYSLVRAGKSEEAQDTLHILMTRLDTRVEWHQEIATRLHVMDNLLTHDPSAAHQLLDQWEANSMAAIGI